MEMAIYFSEQVLEKAWRSQFIGVANRQGFSAEVTFKLIPERRAFGWRGQGEVPGKENSIL